ncbi:MAG: hypothetical protein OXF22_02885 [Anaerolineaceae bacterium]|nr:hypothetical protein [Anaerolineaceae bacterium]
MISPKPENFPWLALFASLMLVSLLIFPPTVQLLAALGSLAATWLTFFDFSLAKRRQRRQHHSVLRGDPPVKSQSEEARQAIARAKARGNYIARDLHVLDIGLIAVGGNPSNPMLRRTNSLHDDLQAVRPYLRLRLPKNFYERHGTFRFAFKDPTHEEIYIHEQETWLTAGEQDIIPTHQMPISENEKLSQLGDWILEVYLDERLMAEHSFRISPSFQTRRERLQKGANPASTEAALDELMQDE